MKTAFVDTSVILRIILRERGPFRGFSGFEAWYASRLLSVEARRVLQRLYIIGDLTEEQYSKKVIELSQILKALSIVQLRERVIQRAEDAFPLAVSTLDALHVSSALLIKQALADSELVFVTHDSQQAKVARACGLAVEGV